MQTLLKILFPLMIAIQIVPVWQHTYFPSQDGPSHLYNAVVLANYDSSPLYQEWYTKALSFSGNAFSQVLLVLLLKIVRPLIAEKILLTVYLVLFPIAMLYFIRAFEKRAWPFSFVAFICSYNLFLHAGFWNFCFSVPFALLGIGSFVRTKFTYASAAILLLVSVLIYSAHILSWGLFVGAICVLAATREEQWKLVPAALLPGVAAAAFLSSTPFQIAVNPLAFTQKLEVLYGLDFLRAFGPNDGAYRMAILAAMAILTFLAVSATIQGGRNAFTRYLLALAAMSAAFAVFGPDTAAGGAVVRERIAFYAFLFFVATLSISLQTAGPVVAIVAVAISLGGIYIRHTEYEAFNLRLADYARAGEMVSPGSTAIALWWDEGGCKTIPAPVCHAIDLWTPKPFIDLKNYEAAENYFPIRFRPEKSAIPLLGPIRYLEAQRPLAHWNSYLSQPGARIDYILIDREDSDPLSVFETTDVPPGFKLVVTLSRLKLYRNQANF